MTDNEAQAAPTVAQPELAELQQEESTLPAVDVRVVGPVQSQHVPNRLGQIDKVFLAANAAAEQLLSGDLRRARATLISTTAFNIRRKRSGASAAWPANVALVVTHGDEMWGSATSDATVTVVTEFYAD